MGIFGALTTAVSGLQAQSFALENISGNIANSQTAAFKRTDTSFSDLVLSGDMNVRRQTSGSVSAFSRSTNDLQGTLTGSSSATSLGIKGSGFLVVQSPTGEVDGAPIFGGGDVYTRRGDFELDKNGYLVNGAGFFLTGEKLDPATGNSVGARETIKLDNDFFPATATTAIDYRANLPTVPKNANYDAGDPNSWLLDGTIEDTASPNQSTAFLSSTVPGEALTVYDARGGAHDLQLRWGKVANEDTTADPPVNDTWALFYQSNSRATGDEPAWARVDADPATAGAQGYTFDGEGKLLTPEDGNVTLTGLTIDGDAIGDVVLAHGAGLTQFAASDGAVSVKQFAQNGAASGEVVGVEIADGGAVTATYSNGKTRALYKISLVDFASENRLAHLDGGAFAKTIGSGEPLANASGSIVGQAIEQSNVDIADEFTKMIVTQQAYSANTRVISTSDTMMQDTLNMIR